MRKKIKYIKLVKNNYTQKNITHGGHKHVFSTEVVWTEVELTLILLRDLKATL